MLSWIQGIGALVCLLTVAGALWYVARVMHTQTQAIIDEAKLHRATVDKLAKIQIDLATSEAARAEAVKSVESLNGEVASECAARKKAEENVNDLLQKLSKLDPRAVPAAINAELDKLRKLSQVPAATPAEGGHG